MTGFQGIAAAFSGTCDPRAETWLLMGNPIPLLLLLLGYVLFASWWAPRLMAHRDPLPVRRLVQVYNLLMVLWNGYFVVTFMRQSYFHEDEKKRYSWLCQGADFSSEGLPLLTTTWWFLVMKIAELLDTVTFVLTKNFGHISTLHVFHHASVVAVVWTLVQTGVQGQNVLPMAFNALVHVIMYTYYFLTTLGPEVRKRLWWKRYLTLFQMAQLASFVIFGTVPLFVDCGFPRPMSAIIIGEPAVLLVMFSAFYRKSYTAAKNHAQTKNGFHSLPREKHS
ncbi:very long chain fatty acid elongase AAEL008004-like [Amblyomma americanum]